MLVKVVPGTVFVMPRLLKVGDAGRVVFKGLPKPELTPGPGDWVPKLVPGLIVPVCGAGVGAVPMVPVEAGLAVIAPGAAVPGLRPIPGAVLTPAPPLVTPVAAPEEVPDGVEAAPVEFGTMPSGLAVP